MNREDIIRVAEEGGLAIEGKIYEDVVIAVAMRVAAAELEKVAAWMHSRGYATGHGDTVEDMLKEVEWQAAERERVAWHELAGIGLATIAVVEKAIRARGET